MGIDVSLTTIAWISFTTAVAILSYLAGGFYYWNRSHDQIKELNQHLRWSYEEADQLREVIHSCACRSKRDPSVKA